MFILIMRHCTSLHHMINLFQQLSWDYEFWGINFKGVAVAVCYVMIECGLLPDHRLHCYCKLSVNCL